MSRFDIKYCLKAHIHESQVGFFGTVILVWIFFISGFMYDIFLSNFTFKCNYYV